MPNIVVALLIVVLLIFAIIATYLLRVVRKMNLLNEQVNSLSLAIEANQLQEIELQSSITKIEQSIQEPLLENEQVTKQLTVRTKNLQEKIVELSNQLEKLKHEQPEDKLYRRALRMVELGADINEVMSECELPRAEAELLFSIHLKSQDRKSVV